MTKLLLIDGNNLFHRAYHALPPLTDKTGTNVNAVYGFSNMILKAIDEVKPDFIACAFDTKAPTFRHVEFEAYKAQRAVPPPDLYPQLPKVKGVLDAFGIKYFEKAGYEADDLLASIATQILNWAHPRGGAKVKSREHPGGEKRGNELHITILSGDRDLLQLVDGNIKVQAPGWNLKESTLYGSKEVKEKYGLEPHQMIDYKSLVGDTSDNVPGIAGVGPKTASSLLQKYHTLENLFDHIGEVPEKVSEKLKKDKDIALTAKKLVALDTTIDMGVSLEDLSFEPDWERVRVEYESLGFKSIVAKVSPAGITSEVNSSLNQESTSEVGKSKNGKKKNSDQLELI